MITPYAYVNVKGMQFGCLPYPTGPTPNIIKDYVTIVTGVALTRFPGNFNSYNSDDFEFFIPNTNSVDNTTPLELRGGGFQLSCIAFPATFESLSGEILGWGIDSAELRLDSRNTNPGFVNIKLVARIVAMGGNSNVVRVGFQATIVTSVD